MDRSVVRSRGAGRWASVSLGAGLAVVLLAPLLLFRHFPSQDGPTHLENAALLLGHRGARLAALRTFYEVSLEPVPNWLSHACLAALQAVVGPGLAEKVLLLLYATSLPLAFGYAVRAVRPDAGAWRFAPVAPFVYNHVLHLGYYNQAIATVPFLCALGFWLRREGCLGAADTARLALLLLWVYSCHLVTTVLALLGLMVLAVGYGRAGPRPEAVVVARRLAALLGAAAPASFLAAWFLASQRLVRREPGPAFGQRLAELAGLRELVSYDRGEAWIAGTLAAAILGTAGTLLVSRIRRRDWSAPDALLLVAASYTVVYFAAAATRIENAAWSKGGGTTHDRVGLYVYLALLLWMAGQRLGPGWRDRLAVGSAAAAAALLAVRLPRYAELDDQITEYLSVAPALSAGSTLLPVSFAHEGKRADGSPISLRVLPFLHAAGRLAVEREVVEFTNYAADLGYFPVRFRLQANPYRLLGAGIERAPPCVDFARYEAQAPRPIDFVLVWDARFGDPDHRCGKAVRDYLDSRYDRVFVSDDGRAELYRRRATAPSGPAPARPPRGRVRGAPTSSVTRPGPIGVSDPGGRG